MSNNQFSPLSGLGRIANRSAASAALGHVPSPADTGISNRQFGFQIITVKAGNKYPISISGDYVYVEIAYTTTAVQIPELSLRFQDSNNNTVVINNNRQGYIFPKAFDSLDLFNDTAFDIFLRVYIGFGRIQFDLRPNDFLPAIQSTRVLFNKSAGVTAYAANQVIAATGAASVGKIFCDFQSIVITGFRLTKSSPTIANTHFSLYLSAAATPALFADHASFVPAFANFQYGFSTIDIPAMVAPGGSAAYFDISGLNIPFVLSQDLDTNRYRNVFYYYLVANDAYVPTTSESFSLDFIYNGSRYN